MNGTLTLLFRVRKEEDIMPLLSLLCPAFSGKQPEMTEGEGQDC